MRIQKYLFLFQHVIQHSFLPQKYRMDTEKIVVGPKHSALMFGHRNIVLRFQRFLLTLYIRFLYSLLKTFASHVSTSKSLIWVQILTLGLFWFQNEIFVWIWSIKLSLYFGKPKDLFLFENVIQHSILLQKDRMDTKRIVVGPKHSASMFWHRNILLWFQRFLLTSFIRFLYFLLKNFFLTCFNFKISHLGPNDYPRLVLDPK